ncbi:MAG: hypothetical protein VCD00_08035 [Candidatus Hydrogenedentota bacterium]
MPNEFHDSDKDSHWHRRTHIALLTLFGVTALAMVVIIALSIVVPPVMQGIVKNYTDESPVVFDVVAMSEEERDAVDARLETFEAALESSEDVEPLELTEHEINGLIGGDEEMKEEVLIAFEDGFIAVNMSLPIDSDLQIGPWSSSMQGRYLNGVAILDPQVTSDGLVLELQDFLVREESVPRWMLSLLQDEINRQEWLTSQDIRDTISRLERIAVEGDELVLYPKNE